MTDKRFRVRWLDLIAMLGFTAALVSFIVICFI